MYTLFKVSSLYQEKDIQEYNKVKYLWIPDIIIIMVYITREVLYEQYNRENLYQ